ncbi:prepilin peptidase [Albirhodobacter sp. R86504]|jgi:prepilin peptidase CpaA|uniref:prepilin peptidase n=1 Tax=Albirhodobacter sp. R86504 TaxID=3093848 RepID=UPI003671EF10
MLGLSPNTAYLVLFLATLPVSFWVIWSDLKFMKIPNKAVIAMLGIFVIVGLLVIPFEAWLWRWSHFVVVLVIGIVLNATIHFGAGDAKYAAAAAPFIALNPSSIRLMLVLLAAVTLSAFVTHRIARGLPALRGLAPDWLSWSRKDFPFGVPLALTLSAYLLLYGLG